jgi:hypothetical protein
MTEQGMQTAGKLETLWCNLMHDSPMWPIHDHYECRDCGRQYLVPWSGAAIAPVTPVNAGRMQAARFSSALLPLVLLMALLPGAWAQGADTQSMDSTSGAGLAFARYTTGAQADSVWASEIVEISAVLPKLGKQGRLRAIRRLLPLGRPEYQVLDSDGDQTVRRQVIARYLQSDQRASAMPASSVAITPANYRFRFKGRVDSAESVAYAFQITPRKKRTGLIKGELWLSAETGAVVRESGYLVRSPSVFIKRVQLTREMPQNQGGADTRVTHVSVDTRLVGRAELTIVEKHYADAGQAVATDDSER